MFELARWIDWAMSNHPLQFWLCILVAWVVVVFVADYRALGREVARHERERREP